MKYITKLLLFGFASVEISHHMPPNYRQSSLQIQDLSNHHTRSTHGHHHSHSNINNMNRNRHLSDIQSNDDYNESPISNQTEEEQQYVNNNNNNNNNDNNIKYILKAVRREYQQQVDHVIGEW
eukprot:226566_1